jgi:hypothetical protein
MRARGKGDGKDPIGHKCSLITYHLHITAPFSGGPDMDKTNLHSCGGDGRWKVTKLIGHFR